MDKLESKDDIENCSNASPYLGGLLAKKRTAAVVLPQVFEILGQRINDDSNESYWESWGEHVDWITNRMEGLLKCRLVCKSWDKAIEKVFEEKRLDIKYVFTKRRYSSGFLEFFAKTHCSSTEGEGVGLVIKNPFVGRRVLIAYHIYSLEKFNFLTCLQLAELYGREIWYLEVEIEFFPDGMPMLPDIDYHDRFYSQLRELVEFTPNLKSLSIRYTLDRFYAEGRYPNDARDKSYIIQYLEDQFEHPFPTLANMEHLEMDSETQIINIHILHQNPHISRLTLLKGFGNAPISLLRQHLPNLRELRIQLTSEQDFELFESHVTFLLPLKKLEIDFYWMNIPHSGTFPFVSWARVFDAIEYNLKADLCTHLLLHMPAAKNKTEEELIKRESSECRLDLPNLEHVEIQGFTPFCLDFLRPSRNSLASLKILGRGDDEYLDIMRQHVVQVFGDRIKSVVKVPREYSYTDILFQFKI